MFARVNDRRPGDYYFVFPDHLGRLRVGYQLNEAYHNVYPSSQLEFVWMRVVKSASADTGVISGEIWEVKEKDLTPLPSTCSSDQINALACMLTPVNDY